MINIRQLLLSLYRHEVDWSFSSACSGIVFEPVRYLFGLFWTRLLMSAISITGHVCLIFWRSKPYIIYLAWNLMGFSTFIYLTSGISYDSYSSDSFHNWGIKEQCIYFPHKQKFTIALINGFYNLSAGMFVINKENFIFNLTWNHHNLWIIKI